MGVVGRTKVYGPWRATMELTKGRGPFPIVMASVEAYLMRGAGLEIAAHCAIWYCSPVFLSMTKRDPT